VNFHCCERCGDEIVTKPGFHLLAMALQIDCSELRWPGIL
jgi:hypothetical protein